MLRVTGMRSLDAARSYVWNLGVYGYILDSFYTVKGPPTPDAKLGHMLSSHAAEMINQAHHFHVLMYSYLNMLVASSYQHFRCFRVKFHIDCGQGRVKESASY